MILNLWKTAKDSFVNGVATALGHKTWKFDQLLPTACIEKYGSERPNFFSSGFKRTSEEHNLLFFAELSMLAYSESEKECRERLAPFFDIPPQTKLLYDLGNRITDPDVLVFEHKDEAFVAFRGTEPFSVLDWKTDAAVDMASVDSLSPSKDPLYKAMTAGNGAEVHRGFWSSASVVRDDPHVMGMLTNKKTIWICGHR